MRVHSLSPHLLPFQPVSGEVRCMLKALGVFCFRFLHLYTYKEVNRTDFPVARVSLCDRTAAVGPFEPSQLPLQLKRVEQNEILGVFMLMRSVKYAFQGSKCSVKFYLI